MDNTLVGVLIGGSLTLAGAIITNLFNRSNTKLQLKHQKESESEKLMRSKLEELYELLFEFQAETYKYYVRTVQIPAEHINVEIQNELIAKHLSPINRIITMMTFYAPILDTDFEKVHKCILLFQGYSVKFQEKEETDLIELDKLFKSLQDAVAIMIKGVEEIAKTYTTQSQIQNWRIRLLNKFKN